MSSRLWGGLYTSLSTHDSFMMKNVSLVYICFIYFVIFSPIVLAVFRRHYSSL
jgi:hypothetical protein